MKQETLHMILITLFRVCNFVILKGVTKEDMFTMLDSVYNEALLSALKKEPGNKIVEHCFRKNNDCTPIKSGD